MIQLGKLAAWFVLLRGWRRAITALVLGLVSVLALPPLDFSPVLFLTLPALVWIMDGVYGDAQSGLTGRLKAGFAPGWWFGFGYFTGGLWWIGNALLVEADAFAWAIPIAILVLPAVLAVFWGIATLIARIFWSDGWGRVFALALGLGAGEYLRGTVLTGFPWNGLGYAAMPVPVLMQSASVLGLYGMNVLAVLIFALPLTALASIGRRRRLTTPLLLALVLMAGHAGFGMWRSNTLDVEKGAPVRVRIMQPNIAQLDKMTRGNENRIVATYLDLSGRNPETGEPDPQSLSGIDYLVWPESAFPFLLTEQPEVLAAIADMLPPGTRLVTGALRAEPGAAGNPWGKVYNSVFVITDDGEIAEATDKTHLVPFGEYLPFQDLLESIGLEQVTRVSGGFEAGARRAILESNSAHPFIALICYEIIFSGAVLPELHDGQVQAQWLVNVTNDAWYGRSPGPFQHLRQAQIRAVEEGMPMVRVANTGISAAFDPLGRTITRIAIDSAGSADITLHGRVAETIFAQYRYIPFLLLLVFSLGCALLFRSSPEN